MIGDAAPVLDQASVNVLANDQAAAGENKHPDRHGSGDFSQLNTSAVNSRQTGVNGDNGLTSPVLDQDSLTSWPQRAPGRRRRQRDHRRH